MRILEQLISLLTRFGMLKEHFNTIKVVNAFTCRMHGMKGETQFYSKCQCDNTVGVKVQEV